MVNYKIISACLKDDRLALISHPVAAGCSGRYPGTWRTVWTCLYRVRGYVICFLRGWLSVGVSSWQSCWSSRLEPARVIIGAPGTTFGRDVFDGMGVIQWTWSLRGTWRMRGWLRMALTAYSFVSAVFSGRVSDCKSASPLNSRPGGYTGRYWMALHIQPIAQRLSFGHWTRVTSNWGLDRLLNQGIWLSLSQE